MYCCLLSRVHTSTFNRIECALRLMVSLSSTLVYSSSGSVSCPQALLWKQYRSTATATREPARDLNGVLIVFPESRVNAPDAHVAFLYPYAHVMDGDGW